MLTEKGEVVVWGGNKKGQIVSGGADKIVEPQKWNNQVVFTQLSCGYWHLLLVDRGGRAYSQGYSKQGALANHQIQAPLGQVVQSTSMWVHRVYAGRNISYFIDQHQQLYAAGTGKLNCREDQKDSQVMGKVKGMEGVKQIEAGYSHAGLVTIAGILYLWGDNSCYCLATKHKGYQQQPLRVEGVQEVESVSCSQGERYPHTGCVDKQGQVYLWGSNYKYKLGHQDINQRKDIDSQQIQNICIDYVKRVDYLWEQGVKGVQVVSGGIHSAVLDQQGRVYTFGCGSDGRLGHPDIRQAKYLYKELLPIQLQFPQEGKVIQLVSAYYHMLALVQPL